MLSERQRFILSAIVDNYIRSAEPVGSRTISKREGLGISSATIRNEMADLEELGYLEQPHTSAGRVPSTKGYRFYVDNLLKPQDLTEEELGKLKRIFVDRIMHVEQLIEHTAAILSQVTNYTAVVLGPEIFEHRLKHMQIVPLNDQQAVAIIVTHTGRVENTLLELPAGVPPAEIEKLVNILNSSLHDVPLWQLRQRLYTEVASEMRRHVEPYEEMLHAIENVFKSEHHTDRIFLHGRAKIINQPEFRDLEKAKDLFELLEQNDQLLQLFNNPGAGLMIRIGQENTMEAMKNCSIVTTSYYLDGKPVGTVGILGPTRLEYGKVITVLNYLAVALSRILTDRFEGK